MALKILLASVLLLSLNVANVAPTDDGLNGELDEIALEPINATENFKVIRKNKESIGQWYEDKKTVSCVKKAKCEELKYAMCLGSKLPYTHTSLRLSYSKTQEKAFKDLQQYVVLKFIPKCWSVVQPFLCAIFAPKCESINGEDMVYLPSYELCRSVEESCKLIYDTEFFPDYLKCNKSIFPSKCENDVRDMKFNNTGVCMPPLVHTDTPFHFYDNCGLPCKDPLFTDDEHSQIRRLILWCASISLSVTLFIILTFLIDWGSASKYPALVIFYINVCHTISLIGWLAQFVFDSKDDIVCSKDGTRRQGEPSASENLSCVVIFVLVYYFQIAALVWFVIFSYTWHMSFKALGKIQDRIDKNSAYFHLVAWSLPLVLTITTMALGEIDGSSITGICFVGYINHVARGGLLLGPVLLGSLIAEFFLFQGGHTLITVKNSSKDIISVHASSKIRATIIKGAITAVIAILVNSVTVINHIYEFTHSLDWEKSFRRFIVCQLTSMFRGVDLRECVQESRPSVAMIQLQLLCYFASILVMFTWVCTDATVQTWKRYIRKKCGFEIEEPVKFKKHKLIAQAFAQRKEFYNQGRMSLEFKNSHTDPVGLNFELNSLGCSDFSSTWANNLPRFVKRRGALTGAQYSHSQSSSALRRNSQDSQISFSLRHVSVESRRNSLDSQVSVKIAEMKTKVASRRRTKPHKSSRRRPSRNTAIYTRKESTTSIESQISTRILKAVSSTGEKRYDRSLMGLSHRRRASIGLNRDQINQLLANGTFALPFLQNQGLTTSDEENASMTSFKVRDSQLNIVLQKKDVNLSTDDIGINSSTNDVSLGQYQSDSDSEIKNIDRACIKYKNSLLSSEDMSILKNMSRKHNHKEVGGSKSSSKSKSSRKSSRQSGRVKNKRIKGSFKHSKVHSRAKDGTNSGSLRKNRTINKKEVKSSLGSSMDSYSMELARLGVQSSFSGVSAGKNTSRNSKTSCDVGIQANSHEITTQSVSSRDGDVKNKSSIIKMNSSKSDVKLIKTKNDKDLAVFYKNDERHSSDNKKTNRNKDECNEPLLGNKTSADKAVIINKRMDKSNISDSKKLKQLLLPSK